MYKVLQEINAIRWTPGLYNTVISGAATGNLSWLVNSAKRFEFLSRVAPLLWVKKIDDPLLGNREHLGVTTPSGQQYVLVVKETEKQMVMEEMYRSAVTTANGRDSFWSQIANRYAGISRADVVRFLPNQEAYQRHMPVKIRKDVVPIATSRPGELWQVDTIDMNKLASANKGYSRCLTVIDHFSKYAWVKALQDNTATSVATAMGQILDSLPKHLKPRKIQSDNGIEFKGEFETLMRALKIQHSHSYAYTPHAQGCIEVFNKTFKRKVFALLTLNNDRKWVEFVPEIMENYNSTRHSRTRWSPNDLFLGTQNEDLDTNLRLNLASKMAAHRKKAGGENQKGETKDDPRQINEKDYVRISRHTWNPDRRMVEGEAPKNGTFTKKYLANWSREVYIVHKITVPRHARDFENKFWYTLRSVGGLVLQRQFYRQDLMKVDIDATKNGKGEDLSAKSVAEDAKKIGVDDEIELVYNRRNAKIAKKVAANLERTPHPWLIGKILDIYTKTKGWYTRGLVIEYKYYPKEAGKKNSHGSWGYSVRSDVPSNGVISPSGKVGKAAKNDMYKTRIPASWINKPNGNMGSAWRIKESYDSTEIIRSSTDQKPKPVVVVSKSAPKITSPEIDYEELDRLEQEAMEIVNEVLRPQNTTKKPAPPVKAEEEEEIPLVHKAKKKKKPPPVVTREMRWKKFFSEDMTIWHIARAKRELDDVIGRLERSYSHKERYKHNVHAENLRKEIELLEKEGWRGDMIPLNESMLAEYEKGYRPISKTHIQI